MRAFATFAALALATAALVPARAAPETGWVYGQTGGWAYDITGTYTNTEELDLQDDLGLDATAREQFAFGYRPVKLGWIPALELDYVRIAADGQQTFTVLPVMGLPGNEQTVDDRTNINDFELNAAWPLIWGAFTLSPGLTVTHLNGDVMVADEQTGERQTQKVNETFPLLSLGLAWQPLETLRFAVSGDYARYQGNRADELDARALWKALGPVGVEVGYRQRRYKISQPMADLDAKVAGLRFAIVIEAPF